MEKQTVSPALGMSGASAMISIRRFAVDPNRIGAVVVSHSHGDPFGGLPFFLLDAQVVSRRARPPVVAGPRRLTARLAALMEAARLDPARRPQVAPRP